MVQGHTLDVLLTPAHQFTPWYNYWLFCRGFTAPMFMTLSGFGFALATLRRWEGHLQFGPAVAKRLRRFAFFVLLGYSMRIPVRSLRDLRWAGPDAWQGFLQVDVLQTIGFTLIALQLLVLVLRTPRRLARGRGNARTYCHVYLSAGLAQPRFEFPPAGHKVRIDRNHRLTVPTDAVVGVHSSGCNVGYWVCGGWTISSIFVTQGNSLRIPAAREWNRARTRFAPYLRTGEFLADNAASGHRPCRIRYRCTRLCHFC